MARVFLFVFLFVFSCNKAKEQRHNSKETIRLVNKNDTIDIPSSENLLEHPDLFNLTQIPHSFSNSIVFNEVNIIKTDIDTYTIIFVIDEFETNLEELSEWKVGIYFIAKDYEKFSNEVDRTNKYKSQGLFASPVYMGNEVVVYIENLKLEPKYYSLIRMHLYKNNDIVNNNYYKISDVILP